MGEWWRGEYDGTGQRAHHRLHRSQRAMNEAGVEKPSQEERQKPVLRNLACQWFSRPNLTSAQQHWGVVNGFWAGRVTWSHLLSDCRPLPTPNHTASTVNALGIFLFQLTTSQRQREGRCLLIQGKRCRWDNVFGQKLPSTPQNTKAVFPFCLLFFSSFSSLPHSPPSPTPPLTPPPPLLWHRSCYVTYSWLAFHI